MIEKIKTFLSSEQGKRLIYESKSFLMTFSTVLVGLVGAENFTNINAVFNGWDLIISSLGLALSRTVVIFILQATGIADYRGETKKFI